MTNTPSTQVAGPSKQRTRSKTSKKRDRDEKSIALWTSLGVNDYLANALVARALKRPTPIQRTCLPSAFARPRRDIIGTSRTGSGKTLAYLVPVIQHIQQSASPRSSPSAVILCPNRELALQILRVGKALCRTADSLIGETAVASAISWALAVGGDAMEGQFAALTASPDIIVATPGRFLHLVVEMDYDLRRVHHMVYDEADRLFEMGFKPQIDEILLRLPNGRHSLLFSATLPPMLSEFTRAGLSNPILHQLDNEQSLSPDLQLAFFWTTPAEKTAAMMAVLQDIVDVRPSQSDAKQSTQVMVFVSTKHHVEYLTTLLQAMGYRVSFIYGSLHQVARKEQLAAFRSNATEILIVTDVAARGIDIPIMDHVLNYDFPSTPQQFIHRVGRTARAGRKGQALSLVTRDDLPYFLDLDTNFELDLLHTGGGNVGAIPRDLVELRMEVLRKLEETTLELPSQYGVMLKAQNLYERSRNRASAMSYRAIKEGHAPDGLTFQSTVNPLFPAEDPDTDGAGHQDRDSLLHSLRVYRPHGHRFVFGDSTKAEVLRNPTDDQANHLLPRPVSRQPFQQPDRSSHRLDSTTASPADMPVSLQKFQDHLHWLGQTSPSTPSQDLRQLGDSFAMSSDAGAAAIKGQSSQLKWDRKRKRFLQSRPGEPNQAMIKGENGAKLPATYRTGRYRTWQNTLNSDTKRSSFAGQQLHRKLAVSPHSARSPLQRAEASSGLLSAAAIRSKSNRARRNAPAA